MKLNSLIPILWSVCLILSACNLPGAAAPESSALSTAAAQTVQAVLSVESTQASATTSPVSSTPTRAAACTEAAKYTVWTRDGLTYDVDEVNQPLSPGEVFSMSWILQNTGTCTWDSTYRMVAVSGTPLTTTSRFPLIPTGQTVAPGGTVKVDIPMSAPEVAGEYNSSFELQNERGEDVITFGVITKVGSASSSLAAPGDLKYTYDCTTGVMNIGLNWIDRASGEDGYRIYRDKTKLADIPAGSTTYNDIAPGGGKYDYTVAAFNASGESPTRVRVDTPNCD